MDQTPNNTQLNAPEEKNPEDRRDAVRKLGRYAAYAAPFIVLASNLKAGGAGSGSGGGPQTSPTARKR